MINPAAQDNDRVGQRPHQAGGEGLRALPQRAGRAQVRLHGDHEHGPHRTRPQTQDDPMETALNAFDIAFDGRLSAGRK
jgi:hypothetical protein